eukprot:1727929-Rhodomonas_salina.1
MARVVAKERRKGEKEGREAAEKLEREGSRNSIPEGLGGGRLSPYAYAMRFPVLMWRMRCRSTRMLVLM